jgi:ATP-dependent DNA helicase RecQ
LENFAYGDTPSRRAIERLLEIVFAGESHFDVSYQELANESDIRLLVVRTLLTYLELDGFLAGGTPFYSTYKFRPLTSSAEILSHFEGERREFLERLFRIASKGRTWFQIDLDRAAQATGQPRTRVVRALDYLAERGWVELQAAGMRHRYEVLHAPEDLADLTGELHRRMLARETNEIGRLEQVVEFATLSECQVNALRRHFGEAPSEPCGHCTRCLDAASPRELPRRARPPIDPAIIEQAMLLRQKHPEIPDAVAWARLLCGITSPALTRAKLTSHPLFCACEGQRFAELRARFEKDAD